MRIVIAVATSVAVIVIGITIWFQTQGNPPTPPAEVEAPRYYNTTGGQEMRPRWDNSGGQGDDAAGN
jgi:hypothetical protein